MKFVYRELCDRRKIVLLRLLTIEIEKGKLIKNSWKRNMERYYKILGISRKASKEEIKQAYHNKMRALHPDKVHGTSLEETAHLFSTEINNDYLPFKKIYRYKPNHWLFENFNDSGIIFKLDVQFLKDGSARIDFWNPGEPEETQKRNTSTKLNNVGLLNEFEYGGFGGGMFKVFNLEKYGNIQTIDNEASRFVKYLFEVLRQ